MCPSVSNLVVLTDHRTMAHLSVTTTRELPELHHPTGRGRHKRRLGFGRVFDSGSGDRERGVFWGSGDRATSAEVCGPRKARVANFLRSDALAASGSDVCGKIGKGSHDVVR